MSNLWEICRKYCIWVLKVISYFVIYCKGQKKVLTTTDLKLLSWFQIFQRVFKTLLIVPLKGYRSYNDSWIKTKVKGSMHFWTMGRKKRQTIQAIFHVVPSSKRENISKIKKIKTNKSGTMKFKKERCKEKSSNATIIK